MEQPHAGDRALIVVDMQRDFLPGGALGVAGGDTLVGPIEQLANSFAHVILTMDWHPADHISFARSHPGLQPFTDSVEAPYGTQALWPVHCVQGSAGAELAVQVPHAELILRKGFRSAIDSYSAFRENDGRTPTGLAGYLRERGLTQLVFCGLAYDFCVGASAVDGQRLGFDCTVVEELTRSVALPAADTTAGSVDAMHARLAGCAVPRVSAAAVIAGERAAEQASESAGA